MEPFRIIGNVYFAGIFQASTHIIDTGAGLILIDPGYLDGLYLLVDSIYRLGFKPEQIKYIVGTHWHGDHVAATAPRCNSWKRRVIRKEPYPFSLTQWRMERPTVSACSAERAQIL